MNQVPTASQQSNSDPRYFIWTIVFLVVTGISLVSYIMFSDNGTDYGEVARSRAATRTSVR